MRGMRLVSVGALVLIIFMFVHSQSPQTAPQTSRAVKESAEAQPSKPKKVLVKKLPLALKGIVLEDGQFKLKSGYKFVPQTNNKVGIALQTGGDVKGFFDCTCASAKGGSCATTTFEGHLECHKAEKDPCTETCILVITIDGNKTKLAIF